jgi:hypothetical protein
MPVSVEVSDKEFEKELKEILAKPDSWYLERVDRAVKGAPRRDRKHRRIPSKG